MKTNRRPAFGFYINNKHYDMLVWQLCILAVIQICPDEHQHHHSLAEETKTQRDKGIAQGHTARVRCGILQAQIHSTAPSYLLSRKSCIQMQGSLTLHESMSSGKKNERFYIWNEKPSTVKIAFHMGLSKTTTNSGTTAHSEEFCAKTQQLANDSVVNWMVAPTKYMPICKSY